MDIKKNKSDQIKHTILRRFIVLGCAFLLSITVILFLDYKQRSNMLKMQKTIDNQIAYSRIGRVIIRNLIELHLKLKDLIYADSTRDLVLHSEQCEKHINDIHNAIMTLQNGGIYNDILPSNFTLKTTYKEEIQYVHKNKDTFQLISIELTPKLMDLKQIKTRIFQEKMQLIQQNKTTNEKTDLFFKQLDAVILRARENASLIFWKSHQNILSSKQKQDRKYTLYTLLLNLFSIFLSILFISIFYVIFKHLKFILKENECHIQEVEESNQTLQENNEFIENIFEYIPAGIIVIDAKTFTIEKINNTLLRLVEQENTDWHGKKCYELFHPKTRECAHKNSSKLVNQERNIYTKHNKPIPVLFSTIRIELNNKPCFIEFILNIESLKKAERALEDAHELLEKRVEKRTAELKNANLKLQAQMKIIEQEQDARKKSEEKYRLLFHLAGDLVLLENDAHEIIESNQSFLNHLPKTKHDKQLKTSDFFDLTTILYTKQYFETFFYPDNNAKLPVEISITKMEQDNTTYALWFIRNVYDRKRIEMQQRQIQKMESVGYLASGIAHEINTPIQYLETNLHFLKEAFHDLPLIRNNDSEELLNDIEDAFTESLQGLDEITSIVRSMKSFNDTAQEKIAKGNLNTMIADVLKVSKASWSNTIDIIINQDNNLPFIECNIAEMHHIILNFVLNAVQAISEKDFASTTPTLEITTRYSNNDIILIFNDNGPGISQENLSKIFDPFFTTKEVGIGTGQGLTFCYSVIVNKMKGKIEVDSEVDLFTKFTITIPVERI